MLALVKAATHAKTRLCFMKYSITTSSHNLTEVHIELLGIYAWRRWHHPAVVVCAPHSSML
jgi:hypothetical protein